MIEEISEDELNDSRESAENTLKNSAKSAYVLAVIYSIEFNIEKAIFFCDLAVRLDGENEKYSKKLEKLQNKVASKSSLCPECGSVHAAGQNSMCNL